MAYNSAYTLSPEAAAQDMQPRPLLEPDAQRVADPVRIREMNRGQTSVKIFRELTVFGEPDALESVISKTESGLTDGWFRDRESETKFQLLCRERAFCFLCRAKAERPEVALVMSLGGRRLTVTNIVPNGQKLSVGQYNSILAEFYLKFLHPEALEAGLAIELSSDERTIEEAFGSTALELLRKFSRCANKSMTHPADRNRWLDFLISLHDHSNRDYALDLLAKWLREDGWSAEKASRLVSECEFALDLLRAVDRNGLSALRRQRTRHNLAE